MLGIDIGVEAGQVNETVSVTARARWSRLRRERVHYRREPAGDQPACQPQSSGFSPLAPGVVNTANGPIAQGGLVRKDRIPSIGVNSSFTSERQPGESQSDVIAEFKTLNQQLSAEYGETSGA